MEVRVGNERKYRILQVHNHYQIPGGEDTVVANEKKMLENHGHKVILYSRNNSELKSITRLQKLMIPFITVFNPRTYRDVKKLIKNEHIDIVHVHNTLTLISPSVYYAARAMNVPVVQTIHNFRLLCPNATFYRNGHICEDCVSKGLLCAVKHNCYRDSKFQTLACVICAKIHRMTGIYKSNNYICLTEFNKEKLLQLKQIQTNRVFVKPNFVESTVEKIVPYRQRHNQFIFVGRIDELKGIDILFEAWKQMGISAPKLIVCGIGPMEDWCRRFIKNNNVNIEMRGFVPNKEAKQLIANSRALILPTRWYEGFPMTIVEAYSMGTPVICSDIGNAGSLIKIGTTGLTFKCNSDSLFKAVNELGEIFPDEYKIREFYNMHYSSDVNYNMIIRIYAAICS